MRTNQKNEVSGKPRRRSLGWLLAAIAVISVGIISHAVWSRWPNRIQSHQAAQSSTNIDDSMGAVVPISSTKDWENIDDPASDGWSSELRAARAKQTLDRLCSHFVGNGELSSADLERFCDKAFVSNALIPQLETSVYRDDVLNVTRWSPDAERGELYRGYSGFKALIQSLRSFWSTAQDARWEVKTFHVVEKSDGLETHQYVAVSGRLNGQWIEQHGTWATQWTVQSDAEELQLKSIQLMAFEQTTSKSDRHLFSDCTESALRENDVYRSQFLYGMNYWLDRTQDMRYFSPLGNAGLAIGDVNGDGLDDLFVCQEANLPNRLFLQQADGTAREVSADWHVDWLDGSRSALLIDLDNDGDQDLAVTILGGLVVAENVGQRFVVRDVLPTHDDTTSLTAADYDQDGDLDLYVCVDYPNDYFGARAAASNATGSNDNLLESSLAAASSGTVVQGGAANRVYHDSNQAGQNSLFRNESSQRDGWSFVNVTDDVGLGENNRRFSWAACWEDYDNDGDQDLYVANDFGRNSLYRNDAGRFTDVAKSADVEDMASGMSAAWADIDHDGKMDLYVGNMFSSAGSRITLQPAFKQGSSQQVRQQLRRFARGSSLFRNLGTAGFRDVSQSAGVTLGRWAWSSNFIDINNDGWQDIAIANGYITAESTSDL